MQQHEQQPPEKHIPVTVDEANLISNLIYASMHNMKVGDQLDEKSHKMAQDFMIKLQRAALSIKQQDKQPAH